MRTARKCHSDEIAGRYDQESFVWVERTMLKGERVEPYLGEELWQLGPLEQQEYHQERQMQNQQRFLDQRTMLNLLAKILEVYRLTLGEMTRKIVSHSYVALRILHKKLKSEKQLDCKDSHEVN